MAYGDYGENAQTQVMDDFTERVFTDAGRRTLFTPGSDKSYFYTHKQDPANFALGGIDPNTGQPRAFTEQAGLNRQADAMGARGTAAYDQGQYRADVGAQNATARTNSWQGMAGSQNAIGNRLQGYGLDEFSAIQQFQNQAGQQRGMMGQAQSAGSDQLRYMQAVQRGQAGPSLAELQSQEMLGNQIGAQMAMAKSGSSFNPAAQQSAQMAGQQMADQQRMQAAQLRAAEQMQARDQVSGLIGSNAGMATNQQQLDQAMMQAQAARAAQLSGMGQQAFGNAQNAEQLGIAQSGVAQGWDASQQGWSGVDQGYQGVANQQRGMGYDVWGQQLQGSMGMEQQSLDQQLAANQANQAKMQFNTEQQSGLGKNAGALLGAAGGLMAMSDEHSKQQIEDSRSQIRELTRKLAAVTGRSEAEVQGLPQSTERDARQARTARYLNASSAARNELDKATAARVGRYGSGLDGQRSMGVESDENMAGRFGRAYGSGLGDVKPISFEYTPDGKRKAAALGQSNIDGTQYGVGARQLEASGPAGQAIVRTMPDGSKVLDKDAVTMTTLSAAADQQRQLDDLTAQMEQLTQSSGKDILMRKKADPRLRDDIDQLYSRSGQDILMGGTY